MLIIIISSFLYGISFLLPKAGFLTVLMSSVLLGMLSSFSFTHAFLWGLCAYGMHLHGLIPGVIALAPSASFYAWLPGIFLMLYLSLVTAVWWSMCSWCEQQLASQYKLLFRTLWLWSYWLFITYGCLFFCGRWEGYLLANPLIPCIAQGVFLSVISWFGVAGATVVFCILSALLARMLIYKKYYVVLLLICCSTLMNYKQDAFLQNHASNIAIVQTPISSCIDDTSICHVLSEQVACVYAHNPNLKAIIFPESCVYSWKICAESALADYMPTKKRCDYIVGSFYQDGDAFRNSCYWLRNGIVHKRFDKRHAMPLIERLPWFLHCSFFKEFFFAEIPEVVPSGNERPVICMGDIPCVPYICSELFFNRVPDDEHTELPIVALVNDRWAPPYLQRLMYWGAIIQAYAWHRAIVYASYTYWNIINPCFSCTPLIS